MARQRKTLPARRRDAMDDSLLIRSAESLGRMIGSLQRQLDAARQIVSTKQVRPKPDSRMEKRGNGEAPASERNVKMKAAAQTKTAANRKATSRVAMGTSRPAARKQSAKRRPPRTR